MTYKEHQKALNNLTAGDIAKIWPLGTERFFDNQLIRTRLKCEHRGCKKCIQGIEGYNGNFYYSNRKTHQEETYDLRNQVWFCSKHCEVDKKVGV